MSLWNFAASAGPENLEAAAQALQLSAALLAGSTVDDLVLTPGAGLIVWDKRVFPVVLADPKLANLAPGATALLRQVPVIERRVAQVLRSRPDWLATVRVRGITAPEPQFGPGDDIVAAGSGKAGCQVTWSGGSTGFLTAGHVVASSVGSSVYDAARGIVGTLVWANDPAGHGTTIESDMAVVELSPQIAFAPAIVKSVVAGPAAVVTVASSGAKATIMGMSHYLYMPAQNATCGDTYFTTAQVTRAGDSGSPVTLGSDLVGHVIGASLGTSSFFQSVDYQLGEAIAHGGLAGLRI